MVDAVYRDAEFLLQYPGKTVIETCLGVCSHWLAPHRVRWTAYGGFAWPSGYYGLRHSIQGLPQTDWRVWLMWDRTDGGWYERRFGPRRPLTLHVTVPARTALHSQAAIHTIWSPGSPSHPTRELKVFYGFRKIRGTWELRATSHARDQRAAFDAVTDCLAERSSESPGERHT
ncbi:MAG: hypothetical protein AB7S26_39710 [Sandaracinaceae bacterium]